MDIRKLYQLFLDSGQISTDSRNVIPGSIFFGLKGDSFDGNLYAASAIGKGAAWAVTDKTDLGPHERLIYSGNTLETLQQLANLHRRSFTFPVIAITGSNGKTTTKELVASVLSKKFRTSVTKGNLNNHIGVPLTLLAMDNLTQAGVVEMGANHPGEIDRLCRITEPDFGLITNIGKAHLEGFGSFEGVIRTKTELSRFLEASGGTLFLNSDNALLTHLAETVKNKITYGSSNDCFQRAELLPDGPFVRIKTWFGNKSVEISSRLTGNYNFENMVAAVCIGRFFQVDPLLIKEAIENYVPQNNRSQMIGKGSNKIILDAYNANPSSMMASIKNIMSYPDRQKVLIIGDMLELGPYSAEEHQNIIDFIRDKGFSLVILVGKNFNATSRPGDFISLSDVAELDDFLRKNPVTDSLILLKGSRGIQLEKALPSV